jgi:hypothetical protein
LSVVTAMCRLTTPRCRPGALLAFTAVLGLALTGCGSSSSPASSGSKAASAGTSAAATTASAASVAATPTPSVAAAAQLPGGCSSISKSLVGSYIGTVAVAQSLATRPNQVSCEFISANSKMVLILNIGKGTPADFAIAKQGSGGGGRTVTDISGLGTMAFSISKGGLVHGMEAFSDQDVLFVVTSTLTATQDESLIRQLMQTY